MDSTMNSTSTTTANEDEQPVIVSWTPIYVTLLISCVQGIVFYLFFIYRRNKDSRSYHSEKDKINIPDNDTNDNEGGTTSSSSSSSLLKYCNLYESRQYNRQHRSPPPFQQQQSVSWWKACIQMKDDDVLGCVGLDTYMFLRLLYLGARITGFGTILSFVLLPMYATGSQSDAVQFNLLTIARVEQGSTWRLYVTVGIWYLFCIFIMYEFWKEWKMYYHHRTIFDATGDRDMPIEYRYTVRVEQIRKHNNTDTQLYKYFHQLFPNKVHSTVSVLQTQSLEKLIDQRQKMIVKLEGMITKNTYTTLKKPNTTIKPKLIKIKGTKVDCITYYESEIQRLNQEIDTLRNTILQAGGCVVVVGGGTTPNVAALTSSGSTYTNTTETIVAPTPKMTTEDTFKKVDSNTTMEEGFETGLDTKFTTTSTSTSQQQQQPVVVVQQPPSFTKQSNGGVGANVHLDVKNTNVATTTAFVTFTSLRAKQAAIQCELTGDPDIISVYPVSDPTVGTIWKNVTVPLQQQVLLQWIAACFFTVGILFWAIPVAFVTSISNLNSILQALGLKQANPNVFWYGLVAGLLPVIMLAILMIVLYMVITAAATTFIRYKSYPEVDAYCLYWHMLFQFANLWLLIIGGSLFNQIDTIISDFDINNFVETIAKAMPGASVFFVNMIICSSFNAFGMELSMIVKYVVSMIMNMITPIDARTQRQLDTEHTTMAPSIVWGQKIPPIIFIFMVSIIYMPIVPIMSIFAFVYFLGTYIVMKHQCLHVYAQEVEGGGSATWQQVFGFLMACLYIGEFIFIAYMGIKTAPIQSGLGFVPLIVTCIFHRILYRKYIEPIQTLSLQVAADVDIRDGELPGANSGGGGEVTKSLYRQPVLDADQDERGPLPYRRDPVSSMNYTEAV